MEYQRSAKSEAYFGNLENPFGDSQEMLAVDPGDVPYGAVVHPEQRLRVNGLWWAHGEVCVRQQRELRLCLQ